MSQASGSHCEHATNVSGQGNSDAGLPGDLVTCWPVVGALHPTVSEASGEDKLLQLAP